MSWNDGISKQMETYITSVLAKTGEDAFDSIKETIDIASKEVLEKLIKTAPRDTQGLANSLIKVPMQRLSYYGNKIIFAGTYKSGNKTEPYEKLANILNYGSIKKTKYGRPYENIVATRFVSKAIRSLKGLDKRINDNFIQKAQERGL